MRPPDTLLPWSYCAGISFRIRSKIWAVARSRNSQSTRALPRSLTCRAARSCLAHLNTFSTNLRFLWLIKNPSPLRSSPVSQLGTSDWGHQRISVLVSRSRQRCHVY